MGLAGILFLILMGLVFAAWTAAMFLALWRISKRSEEDLKRTGGGYFTWAGHSLRAYAEFLTSDKDRRERRRLLLLTLVMFAVIAGFVLLAPRLS